MSSLILESIADTTMHRDRAGVHGAIARLLLEFLGAEYVSMYRLIDDSDTLVLVPIVEVSSGDEIQHEPSEGDSNNLRLSNFPEWEPCVRQRKIVQYVPVLGKVHAVLPIIFDREVRGVVVIHAGKCIVERELRHVTAILRILTNHLSLLDYGESDTLTGMLNRKTYEATFHQIRQRLCAADAPDGTAERSWLGMVDIDHFKAINDTYGHLFGDEVLLLVSQLMRKCFRGADRLFRFGGEEFVIVLDQSTTSGAHIAFERLRATIDEYVFPQVQHVTVSLGYSRIFPGDGPSACVERADAALYYAKRHGRNNIRCYDALIETGALTAKEGGQDVELF